MHLNDFNASIKIFKRRPMPLIITRARQLASLKRTGKYPIFIATMPKSGTAYLRDAMGHGLLRPDMNYIAGGHFPHTTLHHQFIDKFKAKSGIYVDHLGPTHENLDMIEANVERLVIHVRDPRQAALSMTHHIDKARENGEIWTHDVIRDDNYWKMSLSQKLDYQRDHFFADAVNWISGWIDLLNERDIWNRVLVTSFEEMKKDEMAFFDRLLHHFSAPSKLFLYPAGPNGITQHFRKGSVDEWKNVLSEDQQRDYTAMIPQSLKDRFIWN